MTTEQIDENIRHFESQIGIQDEKKRMCGFNAQGRGLVDDSAYIWGRLKDLYVMRYPELNQPDPNEHTVGFLAWQTITTPHEVSAGEPVRLLA